MKTKNFLVAALIALSFFNQTASAALLSPAVRETAESISAKFYASAGKQAGNEVAERTAKAAANHGENVLPMLKATGPAGFNALEQAGTKASDVIRLYARKGDEAIWVISENKRLAIFLKHGDSAADALIKHPGIADSLVSRFGTDAAGALNSVSRQNAQRLGILANEGVLSAAPRSPELLPVIGKYGDAAMEFIWRNKGALAATAVLATFLNDPKPYIQGIKELVIDPIAKPIVENTNWTLILSVALLVIFLPFVARSIITKLAMRTQAGSAK